MTDEIKKTDCLISIPNVKEIRHATAEEVAQVNDDVLIIPFSEDMWKGILKSP